MNDVIYHLEGEKVLRQRTHNRIMQTKINLENKDKTYQSAQTMLRLEKRKKIEVSSFYLISFCCEIILTGWKCWVICHLIVFENVLSTCAYRLFNGFFYPKTSWSIKAFVLKTSFINLINHKDNFIKIS